jgi:hypothetical protein
MKYYALVALCFITVAIVVLYTNIAYFKFMLWITGGK